MSLDHDSPIPLHIQLKEILRREIEQGSYTEKIPSERELMSRFSVSRTTVREAVSALVREGILKKIHGKGTFISPQLINEWLGTIRSFTETIKMMGMKPGIRLLYHGVESHSEIASILGVEKYYAIERLRFADDMPVAIERTYYPIEIGIKLANFDLNHVTLYDALESIGIFLYEAEQKITAAQPTEQDAQLLGITPGTGVLAAERLSRDKQGNIVEYFSSIYRSDKYAFWIKLSRNR
ncbi:GntR family transcriptional regulator [Desulfofundulus sp. TPOSR]|uniref:GntR family transcriptional regulator n=1 Tax=Desulfofundulus sp. TPOSR TaxID=2714340 RepID=UPI001408C925|nr:GntR family transcriptional regulator [Desulfofundulus sp. TPOSR]NHM27458.1 GntR family transcriptional regulator [Desulfofundulus sp. TPOSR]